MNPIEIIAQYWPRLLDGTLMTIKLTFLGEYTRFENYISSGYEESF